MDNSQQAKPALVNGAGISAKAGQRVAIVSALSQQRTLQPDKGLVLLGPCLLLLDDYVQLYGVLNLATKYRI